MRPQILETVEERLQVSSGQFPQSCDMALQVNNRSGALFATLLHQQNLAPRARLQRKALQFIAPATRAPMHRYTPNCMDTPTHQGFRVQSIDMYRPADRRSGLECNASNTKEPNSVMLSPRLVS